MTEQLYRWVKASERNPPSNTDIAHNIRYIPGNGWGKDLKGVAKYVGRWIDNSHGSIDDDAIEWLEPYTPVSGSLEDAAKEYAATGWKMIADGSKEYDKEKYEAFLAGASHSFNKESFLKALRDSNPWKKEDGSIGGSQGKGWNDCASYAAELLNQKEEK